MSLFEPGAEPLHIPAQAHDVYDVTGAGDTVAGILAVSVAAGGRLEEAARLANRASIIVGRLGTTVVELGELIGGPEEARQGRRDEDGLRRDGVLRSSGRDGDFSLSAAWTVFKMGVTFARMNIP